jgi:hypothetical protein
MCYRPTRRRRKKRGIRLRLENLDRLSVVLFEDETDLLLFPPLRAAWSLRGQDAAVPVSGANAKRVVFGTLNIHTGSRLFLEHRNQRAENFQAFLEMVHWHYRGWHVAMRYCQILCSGKPNQAASSSTPSTKTLPWRTSGKPCRRFHLF